MILPRAQHRADRLDPGRGPPPHTHTIASSCRMSEQSAGARVSQSVRSDAEVAAKPALATLRCAISSSAPYAASRCATRASRAPT